MCYNPVRRIPFRRRGAGVTAPTEGRCTVTPLSFMWHSMTVYVLVRNRIFIKVYISIHTRLLFLLLKSPHKRG